MEKILYTVQQSDSKIKKFYLPSLHSFNDLKKKLEALKKFDGPVEILFNDQSINSDSFYKLNPKINESFTLIIK